MDRRKVIFPLVETVHFDFTLNDTSPKLNSEGLGN